MLDSPEGVCPGQARFEYPATSVLFSKRSDSARGVDEVGEALGQVGALPDLFVVQTLGSSVGESQCLEHV